ncbi:MAG: lipid-A-disaccharide synthase [Saprospiraceae bacterium]|nr:lipid-A-disaccharide synthase [Saprospiraceae bacterium]
MRYYIIAGEASGDLHGSNLMKQIQTQDPHAEFRFWGGDLMQAVGGTLVKHYADLAFMGFVEVVRNLRTILRNMAFCKQDIETYQPDALILIDYPGFNLRIAKWAKPKGLQVLYYISPQIWAWNAKRVHDIKANVDEMYVILPFEKAFYQNYNMDVQFVGHPLLDVIDTYQSPESFLTDNNLHTKKRIIALLPGSRKQEIAKVLPIMLSVVKDFPSYQFVLAGAPSIPTSFYQQILKQANVTLPIISDQTYPLLSHAYAALVTSGTATLETALFEVPEVVCYKGSPISYEIAKRVIRVKYISLVNLIVDRLLVHELIQKDFNPQNLHKELNRILQPNTRKEIQSGFLELKEKLGHAGASKRAAQHMVQKIT